MSNHYTRFEYRMMGVETLLASDPVHWRTFEAVIGDV
jgi:hypothetical protein